MKIQYQQWAGTGQERQWKDWKGPYQNVDQANNALEAEKKMWPNDNFRIVP